MAEDKWKKYGKGRITNEDVNRFKRNKNSNKKKPLKGLAKTIFDVREAKKKSVGKK